MQGPASKRQSLAASALAAGLISIPSFSRHSKLKSKNPPPHPKSKTFVCGETKAENFVRFAYPPKRPISDCHWKYWES
jgi:hypothetical protein